MKMDNDKKIEEMAKNPKTALFKLAFPAFVSLVSIFFVSFMDSVWVSGLGNVEVTAVGLAGPVFYPRFQNLWRQKMFWNLIVLLKTL